MGIPSRPADAGDIRNPDNNAHRPSGAEDTRKSIACGLAARTLAPMGVRRSESFTVQFDELDRSGRRTTLGTEQRDRDTDGATPSHCWYRGEEFELDVEDVDGVTIYVRRL